MREDALARLASELSELSASKLERLELPESLTEAIDEVRRIKSLPARARQMRVVRAALREAAWPEIRARLDQLVKHGTASASPTDALAREWVVRLTGEGDKAIDALLADHPTADRRHVSQLVRSARSDNLDRKRRAEAKLVQLLRSLFG